jgi:pimeloyl-ACP methyl ester carboxylesterase
MSDGAEVAVHDLGGDGPVAFFTHGTGLCAAMYTPLVRHLDAFRAVALDTRAHGASPSPPDGNMDRGRLATDVIEALEACGLSDGSTIGVGHSSGAHSLLAAEGRRPGTFGMLLCYEPMFSPAAASDSPERRKLLEATVERTLRRRAHFESRDEARSHYEGRGPFARVSPEALAAFLDHGIVDDPEGGVRLACSPANEAAIYASGIEHTDESLGTIPCAVRFAYGALNAEHGGASVRALAERIRDAAVTELPSLGHFGPFEDPASVASWIHETYRDLPGG